jgi:hypothetical protein
MIMPIDDTTIDSAQILGISPITVRAQIYRKQLNAQGLYHHARQPLCHLAM